MQEKNLFDKEQEKEIFEDQEQEKKLFEDQESGSTTSNNETSESGRNSNVSSQNAVGHLGEMWERAKKIRKLTIILIALIGLLSSYIFNAIYFPVTDLICEVTPYSNSILSFCNPTIPNFTTIVEAQVEAQERLLKHSAELDLESSLAHDIKKVELATKDLVLLVKHSNLQYKVMLTQKLKEFAEASFEANSDLQTLQVRAATSLDNTLTYISYILKAIDDYNGKAISPKMQRDLNKLHDTIMKLTEEDIRKLILASDKSLKMLKKLDEMQSAIHEITVQENALQSLEYGELLSNIWSILGGNRVEKSIFVNNLTLLKNLDSKRKVAVERIALISECLYKFQTQLNILREETVVRLLVDFPVEAQLTNIKKALMRLQMNQIASGIKIEKIAESGRNRDPNVIIL